MARFKFAPTIEQIADLLTPRLLRASQHPEHDGSGFGDIHDLIARLADRDRQLEDFLAYHQVGDGSPAGKVSANVGTLYVSRQGGAGTTLYVKESGGSGPTGWVAK